MDFLKILNNKIVDLIIVKGLIIYIHIFMYQIQQTDDVH